jgi:hypothetical protein
VDGALHVNYYTYRARITQEESFAPGHTAKAAVTSVTTRVFVEHSPHSTNVTRAACDGFNSRESSNVYAGCDGVTAESGEGR